MAQAFWAFDDGAKEEHARQEAKDKKGEEEQGPFVEGAEDKEGGEGEPKGVTSSLAPESVGRVLRSRTSRQELWQ